MPGHQFEREVPHHLEARQSGAEAPLRELQQLHAGQQVAAGGQRRHAGGGKR
jgi:hypothetical protein